MKKIPQIIIRAYLRRWPLHLRKSQFNVLTRYSWLKAPLEEMHSEFFQKDDPETDKIAIEAKPDAPRGAPLVEDGKIAEILRSERIQGQQSAYQAERWLGKRGNGDLFTGTDSVSKQLVIIKHYRLPPTQINHIGVSARQQQFQNLARLSHPDNQPQEDLRVNWPIDAIADSEMDDRYFLVMDQRHHGPTLKQWLIPHRSPLPPTKIRDIIGQILQSLMHLHRKISPIKQFPLTH